MATTRLSDVIVAPMFSGYTVEETKRQLNLIASGAVQENSDINAFLAGEGQSKNFRFYNDLADDAENISTSNEADTAVAAKVTTHQQTCYRLSRNKSWSAATLTANVINDDILGTINTRVATYMGHKIQDVMLAQAAGIFGANTTDMTFDSGGTPAAFIPESVIDAAATMGDVEGELMNLMVHPIIYAKMQKQQLIDFVTPKDTEIKIPVYMGQFRVFQNRKMPVASSVYDSYLFGDGAFQFGLVNSANDGAVDVKQDAGNGAGIEYLYKRWNLGMHPVGFSFTLTPASIGEGGPTNAQYAVHANWTRAVAERQQAPFARLRSLA